MYSVSIIDFSSEKITDLLFSCQKIHELPFKVLKTWNSTSSNRYEVVLAYKSILVGFREGLLIVDSMTHVIDKIYPSLNSNPQIKVLIVSLQLQTIGNYKDVLDVGFKDYKILNNAILEVDSHENLSILCVYVSNPFSKLQERKLKPLQLNITKNSIEIVIEKLNKFSKKRIGNLHQSELKVSR